MTTDWLAVFEQSVPEPNSLYLEYDMQDWKARNHPEGGMVITCPNCGASARVGRKWAKPLYTKTHKDQEVLTVGRPCTYCFKTAYVPPKYPGGRNDGQPAKKR